MEFISHLQIAAISPADVNYEETLSTLKFGRFSQSIIRHYMILLIHVCGTSQ